MKTYKLVSRIPALLKAMGIEYPVAFLQKAGISRPTAQKIARGGVYLYPDTLEKIAARLGVTSISELFEFEILGHYALGDGDDIDTNAPRLR